MSGRSPQLSILVVNYNTPHLVRQLLDSIRRHSGDLDYDVIVVDNNSDQEARYFPANDQREQVVHLNRNIGFARAVNLAAGRAVGDYLLFANPDCVLRECILGEMIAYLQQHENCGACSPRLIFPHGEVHSSLRRFPDHSNIRHSRGSLLASRSGGYTLDADRSRKPVEAMSATFLMIERKLFLEMGGFDESYFMYVEDTDLCRRLFDAGKEVIYLGDLEVVHQWGMSTRRCPLRMKFEHHCSIRNYFGQHFPGRKLSNAILTLKLGVNLAAIAIRTVFCRQEPGK